jgi:hypothetical protein
MIEAALAHKVKCLGLLKKAIGPLVAAARRTIIP